MDSADALRGFCTAHWAEKPRELPDASKVSKEHPRWMYDNHGAVLWGLGQGAALGFSWMGGVIPWAGNHGWYSEESELGTGMRALLCS